MSVSVTEETAEITAEEKEKLDVLVKKQLAELGYDDHAQKVITRVNAEARASREAREVAEKEAKALREEVAARKTEDAQRVAEERRVADEAAAAAQKLEDEKKTSAQRIADLEESFGRKLTEIEQAAARKQEEFLNDLKARDAQILSQAVRAEATKRGIIDDELVALLDLSAITIDRGSPDREKIAELIEEHVKAKPHLYKDPAAVEDERTRDEHGRFAPEDRRPAPGKKAANVDWSKLSDKEFAEAEERMRSSRA